MIYFRDILKQKGNVKKQEWHIILGDALDYFYNDLKTLDEKVEFLKDIDFYVIKDEYRRAFVNSTVRYLINKYIVGYRRSEFKEYYTNKYALKKPTFPEYATGKYKLLLFVESPIEFKYNNIFVSNNVVDRC